MRSGSIVASYPRSLATPFLFTCAPYSIKLGKGSSRNSRRFTFCSVHDSGPKLLCFSEETGKVAGQTCRPASTTFDLPEPNVPIVHIEAFANPRSNSGTPALDILCVHEDGQLSCYDGALTQRKWGPQIGFALDAIHSGQSDVIQVSSVNISKARKTFLKNRDDVLDILQTNTGNFAPNLLLVLRRPAHDPAKSEQRRLLFDVLAFKSPKINTQEVNPPNHNQVHELLSLIIPEPKIPKSKRTVFRLHAPSGTLYQGTSRHLFIYNLTALTPQLVRTIDFESWQGVSSYMRISSDMIAMLSGSSLIVIDSEFGSCRANYEFAMPNGPSKQFSDDAQLLAFHDPSGTASVLNGRKLLAIDLSGTLTFRPSSRKRKRGGLLIDAIGRGSLSVYTRPPPPKHTLASSLALGDLMDPQQESTEWEEQKKALNALLEKGDHHEFDRQVSSSLDDLFTNGLSNTHKDRLTSSTHAPPRIVEYVLGQMFALSPHNGPDHGANQVQRELNLKLFFGKIWQSLIRHGLISTERVEAVIRREDNLGLNTNLRDGGLIRAVAECDASLAALLDLLRSSCLIHSSELCHAMKIVISRYSTFVAGHGQKLLSNGNEPGNFTDSSRNDMDMLNRSPNNTLQQLSGDCDLLPTVLDVIIARYDACPTATVTKAFKDHLSNSELQTLVVLLRTKLRQDGWLSSHTEDGLTVDRESQHKDREISMIGKLMNCAVDSLGAGGWVLNNDLTNNAAEAVETISNIQAEISTALEGIWEANYLRALLGELLICGKGALKFQTARVQPALDWRGTPKTALPLGLKLEQDISLVKVGAGGELQKRTRRDIGKLRSRRVPKYSFEQIAI